MKQYIKNMSVEEVISKLKKGEVIHTKYNTQFKMINGMLCHIGHDNKVYINSGFGYNDTEDCYFEAQDPIKLEVGKMYRTRDHKKAFVSAYDANRNEFNYIGIVAGDSGVTTWKANGRFNIGNARTSRDIIGEWTDE